MREEGDPRVGDVAADLICRARAGDGDAFRELTEPHRRELRVHCYRMLGSFQDAEDALQDTLLEGAIDAPPGPQARYEQTEAISLAFVTALQILPPRQLAVLILRDVLGFPANEVADMLDSSVESVKAPSTGPAPACGTDGPRPPTKSRRPPIHPSRMRSWRSSSARGSPPISTRWWPF